MKNLVVVGATSLVARYCSREWLKEEYDNIYLIARNEQKLNNCKCDLQTRLQGKTKNTNIRTVLLDDFLDANKINDIVDDIAKESPPSTVLIAQGSSLDSNEELLKDISKIKQSLELNAISPILFLEKFIEVCVEDENAHIGVIGSVAGDRGRLSNYVYGAGKGCIEKYIQGIHHRLGNQKLKLKVTLIKLGPTVSPMTANCPNQEKMCKPELAEKLIVNAINKGSRCVYVPFKWKIIMFVIRNIPYIVFNLFKI